MNLLPCLAAFLICLEADEHLTEQEIKDVREIIGVDAYIKGKREMNVGEAKNRWGSKDFSFKDFRKARVKERGAMAVGLLRNKKKVLGLSKADLIGQLGRPDGFFLNDHLPAYIIEDGLKTGKESWQLVFFYDTSQEIIDIRIFEN